MLWKHTVSRAFFIEFAFIWGNSYIFEKRSGKFVAAVILYKIAGHKGDSIFCKIGQISFWFLYINSVNSGAISRYGDG